MHDRCANNTLPRPACFRLAGNRWLAAWSYFYTDYFEAPNTSKINFLYHINTGLLITGMCCCLTDIKMDLHLQAGMAHIKETCSLRDTEPCNSSPHIRLLAYLSEVISEVSTVIARESQLKRADPSARECMNWKTISNGIYMQQRIAKCSKPL